MKKLINSLAIFIFAIIGITAFSSCSENCSTIVCDNGACGNGMCVCNAGYEKKNTACIGVNVRYISEDSALTATVVRTDSNGTVLATQNNIAYDIIPSSESPYMFTLKKFNTFPNNDVVFTIKNNNYSIVQETTVTTAAGYIYTVSGSKTGSTITLVITDVVSKLTYTLTYS